MKDSMVEAIAQSSPSGRMSKRARKAAQERLRRELFGPDGLAYPKCPEPTIERRREILLERAAFLRHLADGGMRPRAHRREAAKLEAEAEQLGKETPA